MTAVQTTKGWSDYRTLSVGKILIANKVEVTLSLNPLKLANEGVMNLHPIILQPVVLVGN